MSSTSNGVNTKLVVTNRRCLSSDNFRTYYTSLFPILIRSFKNNTRLSSPSKCSCRNRVVNNKLTEPIICTCLICLGNYPLTINTWIGEPFNKDCLTYTNVNTTITISKCTRPMKLNSITTVSQKLKNRCVWYY